VSKKALFKPDLQEIALFSHEFVLLVVIIEVWLFAQLRPLQQYL